MKFHIIKLYYGNRSTVLRIINLGTRGYWPASRLGRFTFRENGLRTRCLGGWIGPSADLNAVAKKKIPSFPAPG